MIFIERGGTQGILSPESLINDMRYSIDLHKKYKKLHYKYIKNNDIKHLNILENICWFSFPCVYTNYFGDLKVCEHELSKLRQRRKRLYSFVRDMANNYSDLVLLSLTFDDYYLSLSSDVRNRYIKAFLKSNFDSYIACIDFGKKTGREHYHAIAGITPFFEIFPVPKKDNYWQLSPGCYPYGFYSIRKLNKENVVKPTRYAIKSIDYAMKKSDIFKPIRSRGPLSILAVDNIEFMPY